MNSPRHRIPLILFAATLIFSPRLFASMVLQMDLDTLSERSHVIARGKVVLITPGTIELGGAELDTTTFTIAVSDVLKGEVPEVKGVPLLEITMVTAPKAGLVSTDGLRKFSKLPEMPDLQLGQEYLLMTTTPSGATGLSTTVGLGQGCFVISDQGKTETALNLAGNEGLFNGPVSYIELTARINSALDR